MIKTCNIQSTFGSKILKNAKKGSIFARAPRKVRARFSPRYKSWRACFPPTIFRVPLVGLEPTILGLGGRCLIHWATEAANVCLLAIGHNRSPLLLRHRPRTIIKKSKIYGIVCVMALKSVWVFGEVGQWSVCGWAGEACDPFTGPYCGSIDGFLKVFHE